MTLLAKQLDAHTRYSVLELRMAGKSVSWTLRPPHYVLALRVSWEVARILHFKAALGTASWPKPSAHHMDKYLKISLSAPSSGRHV